LSLESWSDSIRSRALSRAQWFSAGRNMRPAGCPAILGPMDRPWPSALFMTEREPQGLSPVALYNARGGGRMRRAT
ncbi:MAG: hypothetical protein MUC50_10425, partial [Myxococcota bacterium]|nr:hypothetical protein [Myxococcota bacterium]